MNGAPGPTLAASVIVPTRDRPAMLTDCVASILAGSQVPREILVVDQSVTENRALAGMGTVRGCVVHYHHSTATGVSAARNEACALAGEEILVFTDDDVVVAPDWLEAMVRAVTVGGETTLVSGRVLMIDAHQAEGFAPSLMEDEQPATYQGRIWNDVLFSNNMGFARAIFDRLGPFDTRLGVGAPYRAATDNDYGFRALEAGYRVDYVPTAVVYHQAWRSKKSYPRLQWAYGVGQGAFLAKHIRTRDRYTLIRLRSEVMRSARLAARGWRQERDAAIGHAGFALGLLYGATRWILAERLLGTLMAPARARRRWRD